MRVFPDTNVPASAFASRGLCAELLELVLLEHDLVPRECGLRKLAKTLCGKVKLPAARSAGIAAFVTGGTALLARASLGELRIVSPRRFREVLRAR